jgi:hypothetical protein
LKATFAFTWQRDTFSEKKIISPAVYIFAIALDIMPADVINRESVPPR